MSVLGLVYFGDLLPKSRLPRQTYSTPELIADIFRVPGFLGFPTRPRLRGGLARDLSSAGLGNPLGR